MDELLTKNLMAMGKWTAARELVAAAQVPAGFLKTSGADGTETFCRVIEGPPKKVEWLGATSLPRSAASSMTADMERGSSSALGLGIGTGYEWLALMSRLGSHQSLFVYEPDAANVRMVLEVTDLSAALESGKLILVIGENAGMQFEKFFRENLGFEVPTMLQQLPSVQMAQRMTMRVTAEAMIRPAVIERTQRGGELVAKLAAYAVNNEAPGLFFLATPHWPGQRITNWMAEAAAEKHPIVVHVDQHASCSLVSRLKLIADVRPQWVDSDFFRGELGMGFPQAMSVMTYVPPLAPYSYFSPDRLAAAAPGPNDVVCVNSVEHRNVILEAGFRKAEQICRRSPALNQKTADALAGVAAGEMQMEFSVALVADLFPRDGKGYGFELPSHLAIFDAARSLIEDDARAGTCCAHRAADLLQRAQRKASVTLEDKLVTSLFERILRHTLIRTISFVSIAQQLVEAGLPVKLVGRSWPLAELGGKVTGVDFGTPAEMFKGVGVILHADPAAIVDPILLMGIAMGKAVVSLEHPLENETTSIGAMFKAGEHYVRTRQKDLATAIRGLLHDSARRNKMAAAARQHLLGAHIMEKRRES